MRIIASMSTFSAKMQLTKLELAATTEELGHGIEVHEECEVRRELEALSEDKWLIFNVYFA